MAPDQLSVSEPTADEQYMLELVNRARMNPAAEAALHGIDLNAGLAPATISPEAKQPVAFDLDLNEAAEAHSRWMLEADTFSHAGAGGSSPGQRMAEAGYVFAGSWAWGENIALLGTTAAPNVTEFVAASHEGLFASAGHRANLLNPAFREAGIGVETGEYLYAGNPYNAVATTQDFARTASLPFLTGVVYNDLDGNAFYTSGEGVGGVTISLGSADGALYSATSMSAGGYQLEVPPGTYTATFAGPGIATVVQTVAIGTENVKFDLVNPPPAPMLVGTMPAAAASPAEDLSATLAADGNAEALEASEAKVTSGAADGEAAVFAWEELREVIFDFRGRLAGVRSEDAGTEGAPVIAPAAVEDTIRDALEGVGVADESPAVALNDAISDLIGLALNGLGQDDFAA